MVNKLNASLTLFRAGPSDKKQATQAISELHQRIPVDEEALDQFLKDPACYLVLAVENSVVVGSLNGYSLKHPNLSRPQFLLYEVDVRPDCRRKGVGEALVKTFMKHAQGENAFEIWVLSNESNKAAIELYQKCGFNRRNSDDLMLCLSFYSPPEG